MARPELTDVARVARDALLLSLGSIAGAALSFLAWIFLARALLPEDYGALGAAMAFVALFQTVGDFGLNYYAIREGAKDPQRATGVIRALLGPKLVMLMSATLLVVALAFLLPFRTAERGLILVYVATLPVAGVATYLSCLLNAHRRMMRLAAIQVGERLAYAVLVPIVMTVGLGVLGATVAAVVSGILYAGFAIAAIRPLRTGPLWPPAPPRTWKPHLMASFQFGLAALLLGGIQRVDVVLLAVLSDPVSLARYVAATQVLSLLLLTATGLAQAAFPYVVRRLHRGEMSLPILGKWTAVLGVLSSALALAASLSAPFVLPVLFGPRLGDSASIFAVLAWAIVPAFTAVPSSLALDALNLQKVHVANAAVMVGISLVLNFSWIPTMGAAGAAWAAVASWGYGLFVGVPIAFLVIRRHGRVPRTDGAQGLA